MRTGNLQSKESRQFTTSHMENGIAKSARAESQCTGRGSTAAGDGICIQQKEEKNGSQIPAGPLFLFAHRRTAWERNGKGSAERDWLPFAIIHKLINIRKS